MKDFYLIAIDSDGTLRDSNGAISDNTKNIIKKMSQDNNYIVICTARPRYHTIKVAEEANASKIIISSNGAEIYDIKNNKILYSKYISSEECKKIYNISNKNKIRVIFVLDDIEYVSMYVVNNSQKLLTTENIDDVLKNNIKQIMLYSEDVIILNKIKNKIIKEFNVDISDSSSNTKKYFWFSVNAKGTNKGQALKYLAEQLQVSKENVIAIGNDNNDISMIEYANIGVAVANSTKELLNVADIIIKSNDEECIYCFLKEWSEKNERNII